MRVPRCPDCGHEMRLDEAHAEWYCPRCGAVVHAYEVDQRARQVPVAPRPGAPRSLGRLERTAKRAQGMSSSEYRLHKAREEAKRLAGTLGCPSDVAERAGVLLHRARAKGLTQGRDLDALAAAALFASCRMLHFARKEEDVAAASPAALGDIQAAYKALVQGLGLSVPAMTALEYLGQLASAVGLPAGIESRAYQLLMRVCGTHRSAGKNPRGWAAAGLVLAAEEAGHDVVRSRVANAAGVSVSTVKARLDELMAVSDEA